jgi:hypothetical protein
MYVLPCGHSFHLDCIALWVLQTHHTTCPNCRANILNTVNTELEELQEKPLPQKFVEKVKLGMNEYIFPAIIYMVKFIFWFVWYIIKSVGKLSPLRLISAFLQTQLLCRGLLYKFGQTRLWTWIRRKSSNTKRKIANQLDQFYTFIIGFSDLLWDIYILRPINSVQRELLQDKQDKTMEIYTYEIIIPTLKAYKHETIPNEEEEPNNLVHTLNKGELIYSTINFSKYKEKK